MLLLTLAAGITLITVGVWAVYWPAALIVLGSIVTLLVLDEAL